MEELNVIFGDFARAFMGQIIDDGDIAFPDRLNRADLDYTLQSLKIVDSYLEHLYENSDSVSDDEWHKTVLWGGAYLGEVIRRNAKRLYNWVDYNEYIPRNPNLRNMIPERTVATCAFLCTANDVMTMPPNKIARFIDEGPENNTHYYASVECYQE